MIETMLLSLLYEGRFYSFPPKTYLDQMDLTVIRPLFFVDEADVIGFWHKYQLPVAKSPCPADGHTRREYSRVYATRKEPQVLSCSSSLRSFMPFMGFLICVSLPGGLRRYYKIHSQCGTF